MKTKSEKLGRNDPCHCGSGLKYKKCCLQRRRSSGREANAVYAKKHNIRLKTAKDIEGIRKAGDLVLRTLDLVEALDLASGKVNG